MDGSAICSILRMSPTLGLGDRVEKVLWTVVLSVLWNYGIYARSTPTPRTSTASDITAGETVSQTSPSITCHSRPIQHIRSEDTLAVNCSQVNWGEGAEDLSIVVNQSRVRVLNVLGSDSQSLPLDLCRLQGVRQLVWRHSELTQIPQQVRLCLPTLETLDLSDNSIKSLSIALLQPFPNLINLVLRGNNISAIAGLDGHGNKLGLKGVDLSRNALRSLQAASWRPLRLLDHLNVSGNQLTETAYEEVISSLPRLQTLDISFNLLSALRDPSTGAGAHASLISLNVSHNVLESLSPGAFSGLSQLKELDLSHNRLGRLPASLFGHRPSRLSRLRLSHNRIASIDAGALWATKNLHALLLDHNQLAQIKAFYFSSAAKLAVPNAGPFAPSIIPHHNAMNDTMVWLHLHTVDLSHNNISEIDPSIFHSTLALVRHIDLAFNRITCLPRYGIETLSELETINVSHNLLQWLDVGTFKNVRLRSINLSHNNLVKLISMAFLYLPAVEHVDLSYNQLDYVYRYAFYKTCSHGQTISIDLQRNELVTDSIWKVITSFRHLQGSSCVVSLHMQNNSIAHILGDAVATYRKHLAQEDFLYFSIWDYVEIYLAENMIKCDCVLYNEIMLLQAAKTAFSSNLTYPEHLDFWLDLRCAFPQRLAGRKVADVLQYMQCSLKKDCPAKCLCVFQPVQNVVDVHCHGRNLTEFPGILPEGPKQLHLGGNNLGVLRGNIKLSRVVYIDLSFNNLRYIDKPAWDILLQVPVILLNDNVLETLPWSDTNMSTTRNISLRNNAFLCTCDNILLKDWFAEHYDKIYDVFNITCMNEPLKGLGMLGVDDADFECYPDEGYRSGLSVSTFSIILGCSLIAGVLVATFIYRYRLQLKLFCVQRWQWQRFDEYNERKTDIFVCYSYNDSKWVNRELLPRLLGHCPPYSVFLQHQDWKPGALLSENLVDSIDASENTLILLSHEFLRTEWTNEECRTLLQQVLQDETHSVYVLLLDDVLLDDLGQDVAEVIRPHACFSTSDDWFWERLFYLLPAPQSYTQSHEEAPNSEMYSCAKY